jgi:hypothetical protein
LRLDDRDGSVENGCKPHLEHGVQAHVSGIWVLEHYVACYTNTANPVAFHVKMLPKQND